MIYQNDSYTFTLPLTRPDTTVIEITGVVKNLSISPYAVYTYELVSGPYLHLGTSVVITGFLTSGNNGTFVIADLDAGTFSVTNGTAVTETHTAAGVVGTTPTVSTSPVIQIIRLSDFTAILGVAAAMTALDGTKQLWAYTWSIGTALSGEYAAIVSYAADGNTFSGAFLEKIRVGDARVIGTVALDSTVAKDATVSKDATVAKSTDLATINPNTSAIVLAIKAKTDNLPADPAGMTLLDPTIQDIVDIHDVSLGNQTVDKTQNPAIFTLKRTNNSVLAQFQLVDNGTETSRNIL